jgi:ParB/RepB/Spo0J family partition protein
MKRKALGKGLSALLPVPDSPAAAEPSAEVPVDRLEANPFQPRLAMDPAALKALAASIRESGMVQPILVRPFEGRYQIIAGERRWRAALELGLATVPVTIRSVPDERMLELALVENIQRQELTPLEEAQAYVRLQEELRLTQEQVAQKVGRDRTTVTNTIRLLRLPREVRELLGEGRLDAGHARALLALERPADQVGRARPAAIPTPGRPRSASRPRWARWWRSRAGAAGARCASRSPASRSCSGSSTCCCGRPSASLRFPFGPHPPTGLGLADPARRWS